MTDTSRRTFAVPDLGEGLDDVTVVEWRVAVGDKIALNEVLCTVETAKAEIEIPCPFAGIVQELGGRNGEVLRVGAPLVVIETAEVTEREAPPAREAESPDESPATLVGYGVSATSGAAAGRPPARVLRPNVAATDHRRGRAKPPVRRLARRLGVDLASLHGSGPEGIVTRSDVESAGGQRQCAPAPGEQAVVTASVARESTTLAVTGVRARIADRMSTSRRTIPDATCSVTIDCTRLIDVVEVMNRDAERSGGVTVSPFGLMCRLTTAALGQHGELNATYRAEIPEIVQHGAVHLGIATSTPRGLLVAVLRDADARRGSEFAEEFSRLIGAARSGTITPAELVGSTFTISNFGALGIDEGIPIINAPEAAILGVGAIAARPHVVDGQVVARPTATLTLAFDHRVADGMEAAALLGAIARYVEAPELALAVL